MKRDHVRQSRRAFSLIELLIVILIIALLVAILLPALGSVRGRSREAATRNLMSNLSSSISMFETDQKKLPGYFTAREMGATANQNEGFSAMNNVLLDLAGGVVSTGGTGDVGPMPNSGVKYDDNAVGKANGNSKAYFTPPVANWKALDGSTEYGTKNSSAGNKFVKELVDAEGAPILAWMQDPMAIGPIRANGDMAIVASGATVSRFYLTSNYVFLNATACGKKSLDQQNESMLGTAASGGPAVSLCGMLGAPGSPQDVSQPIAGILPSAPRGSFVLQSAGRNGVYLGKNERGASRTAGGPTPNLFYGLNFKDFPNSPITDANGGTSSTDVLKDFDDVVVAGS